MNRTFFIVFIALMSLVACKQLDPTPTPRVDITDQRLRDAVIFKAGSNFIYQDSATVDLDSFAVMISPASSYVYDSYTNVLYEQIGYGAGDSAKSNDTYQLVNTTAQQDKITATTRFHQLITNGMLMALPFTENTTKTYSKGNALLVKHYDSYALLGTSYSDVYEVYSTDYGSKTNVHTWFSPNAGILQYSVSGESFGHSDIKFSFSLKRFKALK